MRRDGQCRRGLRRPRGFRCPTVVFDVEQPLKGVSLGPTVVRNGPGTCAASFVTGERYVVYAYRDQATGDLRTGLCSRTRLVRDPHSGADMAYWRWRGTGRPISGLLTGAVVDVTTRLATPRPNAVGLGGIHVHVHQGDGREPISTSTGSDGAYVVSGIRPGALTVTADVPPTFEPAAPVQGVMPTPASCAQVDVPAYIDGRLRGWLLDEQGRPARGIEVHAVTPEAARRVDQFVPALTTTTDEHGAFELRRVGPGRYLLGVDLQRSVRPGAQSRRRFFGGTQDPAAATLVELGVAENRELGRFTLPPLPGERVLTITFRGGGPGVAAATRLFLKGATRRAIESSADGAILRLPYGARYVLEAVAPDGHRVEPAFVSIERDDADRIIELRVNPR